MSTEMRNRVREVFAAVCERPAGEQSRALDEMCGDDAEIRREVESLLGHYRPDDQFLSASAMRDAGFGEAGDSQVAMTPGTRIGRYSITRLIGSGGMGVVYEGRQENPDRKVAIKLMRPGGTSSAMVKRFAQEARALAILQHPGIAQIYDAGRELTAAGPIPYLVMELVEGITLLTFVQRHGLGLTAKLKLILQICDAVAHAHHRGVIHRDLKPTNVLVDETGRARILDFGIARLAEHDARATISTSGGQVLGTLGYMSPEQAGGDPSKIDTRADVYSLGVVLYETLTGILPIDVTQVSISEAVRRIKEIDPALPSAHASECRGELDIITLKALSKDAARRYQSAEALGEDIRRYLTGHPILARGDSALYVLSKHVRRHRVPVAAGVILLIGLVVFSIYASVKSSQEQAARTRAEFALALAKEQQKRADDTAQLLERELHYRNVESARLIARGGNLTAAENILWMEEAAWPGSAATRWGLRDLYRGFLCERTIPGRFEAQSVTTHANSRWVAFTSAAKIHVADISNGKEIALLPISDNKTLWMDFSMDGQYLVHLGERGHMSVYAIETNGTPVLAWESSAIIADASAFDIDAAAASIAIAGAGGAVKLVNLADGRLLHETRVPLEGDARLRAARMNAVSHRLLVTTQTVIYEIGFTGEAKARKVAAQTGVISSLSCSPDGKFAVTGCTDQFVRFYNIASGEMTERIAPSNGSIRSIEFSPDGKYMATLGWWRADLWDAKSHQRIGDTADRPIGGTRLVFSPDSARLLSDSQAGLRVWSILRPPLWRDITAHENYVGKISVSGDARRAVSVDARGQAAVWDATTMTKLGVCGTRGTGWEAAAAQDGSVIALASESGKLEVFEGTTLTNRIRIETKARIADINIVDHDRLVALGTFKPEVQLRDISTGELVRTIALPRGEFFEMEASDDGQALAVLQRNAVSVIHVDKMTLIAMPLPDTQPRSIRLNRDGTVIAMGLFSGGAELWSTVTRKRICVITGHRETISRLAISPDGSVIASAAGDGLMLWDAATGAQLLLLKETPGSDPAAPTVGSLAFIGNSKLIAGYSNGNMEVFDFDAMDRAAAANARKAGDVAALLGLEIPAVSVNDPAEIRRWLMKVNQVITSGSGK